MPLYNPPSSGLNSPAFTGAPTAPTAAPGTATTQIATTDFVRKDGRWVRKTSPYTAKSGDRIFADTNSAPFAITLPPSPTEGMNVSITDARLTFDTHNLIIARNSSNIEGTAENWVADVRGVTIEFAYVDSTIGWRAIMIPGNL